MADNKDHIAVAETWCGVVVDDEEEEVMRERSFRHDVGEEEKVETVGQGQ